MIRWRYSGATLTGLAETVTGLAETMTDLAETLTDLTETVDGNGTHGQPFHTLLVLPEANVILEGEEVKDGVHE